MKIKENIICQQNRIHLMQSSDKETIIFARRIIDYEAS